MFAVIHNLYISIENTFCVGMFTRMILYQIIIIVGPVEIFQLLTMLSCIYFSSLVPKCLTSGIVTQIFPLHDREKLKALEHKWYLSFNRKQPLGNLNSSILSIFGLAKKFFWVAIILFFFPLQTVLKITLEKQLPCILDS